MRRQTLAAVLAGAMCTALVFAAIAVAQTVEGTQGSDTLNGTEAADKIVAKKGADTVNALGGDDKVWTGRGADTANGGLGNDTLGGKADRDDLNGDEGNDFLAGGRGVDDLDGGVGDDTIKGRGDGKAADNIICGDGIDTVRADRNDVVPERRQLRDRGAHRRQCEGAEVRLTFR
jgi:Ca2+-binding RTX toxin-like protein